MPMNLGVNVSTKNLGAPMGIEPVSPAFQASVLTTTPQHPGTHCAMQYRLHGTGGSFGAVNLLYEASEDIHNVQGTLRQGLDLQR